jgi:catechol 2,3-dioxygenase-like lactoylglutathione lyase family enzyme
MRVTDVHGSDALPNRQVLTKEGKAMAVTGMNHFTIVTDALEETVQFYQELLGLKTGYRPPMAFSGAWMYCEDEPVLHIINKGVLPTEKAGILDHMAFSATDLNGTLATLKSRGLAYDLRRQQETGVWQLFFHDPNGARVELDFAADEEHEG